MIETATLNATHDPAVSRAPAAVRERINRRRIDAGLAPIEPRTSPDAVYADDPGLSPFGPETAIARAPAARSSLSNSPTVASSQESPPCPAPSACPPA